MKTPSFLLHGFLCLTTTACKTIIKINISYWTTKNIPFFLSSGFPFFTETRTISPADADGSLLKCPLIPKAEMMNKFLAPVLSAQFMRAPWARPKETLSLVPTWPPLPKENNVRGEIEGRLDTSFTHSLILF